MKRITRHGQQLLPVPLQHPFPSPLLLPSDNKKKVTDPTPHGDQQMSDCSGEWKYPSRCTGYGCDYKITWEYIDESDEISFLLSTKSRNKWTGIGFSNDKAMPQSDAIIGLVEESGRFFLMDTWLRSYAAPSLDPIQNIQNMSVKRENGVTSLKFTRKRKTGDKNDYQFSDTSCPYFIFPIQGGVFNAVNKRLRKHEQVPLISESRICVKSCRPKLMTKPVVVVAASTPRTWQHVDFYHINNDKHDDDDKYDREADQRIIQLIIVIIIVDVCLLESGYPVLLATQA